MKEIENLRKFFLTEHIYNNDHFALNNEIVKAKLLCEGRKLSTKDKATLDYLELCVRYYLVGEIFQNEDIELIDRLVKIGHVKSIRYRISLLPHFPANEKTIKYLSEHLRVILDRAPTELIAVFRDPLGYQQDIQSMLGLSSKDIRLLEELYSRLPQRDNLIVFGQSEIFSDLFTTQELKNLTKCINELLSDYDIYDKDKPTKFIISNRFEVSVTDSVIDFNFKMNLIHSINMSKINNYFGLKTRNDEGIEDLTGIQNAIYKVLEKSCNEKANAICFIDELLK